MRSWKLWLNVVTILALVASVYLLRHDFVKTIENFRHINGWLLLLMIPIEALNYHGQARLYQGLFGIVGNKLSYKFLLRTSIELNFVNHVFPSGGAAGISYFGLRLKGAKTTVAQSTLMHVMKLILTVLSFEFVLAFAVVALAAEGRVNGLIVMTATAVAVLLVVLTFIFAYVVGSQARINQLFTSITKSLNWLIRLVRPSKPETINIEAARKVFDEFHVTYKELRANLPKLRRPFLYALIMNITEIAAVYMVFIAFGVWANIGAVILSYAVANTAGLISVLPGGVGIYEFLMAAILATAGISVGESIPIIVMYRVVNTLIQVPIGYVFYQRWLATDGKGVGLTESKNDAAD